MSSDLIRLWRLRDLTREAGWHHCFQDIGRPRFSIAHTALPHSLDARTGIRQIGRVCAGSHAKQLRSFRVGVPAGDQSCRAARGRRSWLSWPWSGEKELSRARVILGCTRLARREMGPESRFSEAVTC